MRIIDGETGPRVAPRRPIYPCAVCTGHRAVACPDPRVWAVALHVVGEGLHERGDLSILSRVQDDNKVAAIGLTLGAGSSPRPAARAKVRCWHLSTIRGVAQAKCRQHHLGPRDWCRDLQLPVPSRRRIRRWQRQHRLGSGPDGRGEVHGSNLRKGNCIVGLREHHTRGVVSGGGKSSP